MIFFLKNSATYLCKLNVINNYFIFYNKVCGIKKAMYICIRITEDVLLKFIENIEIDSVTIMFTLLKN